MTTNRIQQTARICVLCAFLALAAFSFLAFGSASAHAAPTASTTTTVTTVKIIINSQGYRVFSPAAISVTSGTTVRIVNKTAGGVILFTNQGTVRLVSGGVLKIIATQSQTVGMCPSGSVSITVV